MLLVAGQSLPPGMTIHRTVGGRQRSASCVDSIMLQFASEDLFPEMMITHHADGGRQRSASCVDSILC